MLIGYTRVSSTGRSLTLQVEALTAAGCEKIYSEKGSGRTARNRPELARALNQVRPGDQIMATRVRHFAACNKAASIPPAARAS
jgi:DNA invertase Pin-like site-specific DNA recombinase